MHVFKLSQFREYEVEGAQEQPFINKIQIHDLVAKINISTKIPTTARMSTLKRETKQKDNILFAPGIVTNIVAYLFRRKE